MSLPTFIFHKMIAIIGRQNEVLLLQNTGCSRNMRYLTFPFQELLRFYFPEQHSRSDINLESHANPWYKNWSVYDIIIADTSED